MRELLLCTPDYYGIEYEINPWMSRARGAEAVLAQKQWKQLQATLSNLDCKVHLIAPQRGLPDMVVTLSPWNLWILGFIILTPAFARCPTAGRFGFQWPSTSTASAQSAST